MAGIREASHAGSWYEGSSTRLNNMLDSVLGSVGNTSLVGDAQAIIAPHAGYRYCAATAAHAFKNIRNPDKIKKVFLLGPSHRVHFDNCVVSKFNAWETPIGNIDVDVDEIQNLVKSPYFSYMSAETDLDEHSLEMLTPFLRKQLRSSSFKLVPIMVGSISPQTERAVGEYLAPYLERDDTLFAISSDFCHWGGRFGYTWHDKSLGSYWQSIEHLDRLGMKAIESEDPTEYEKYQKSTHNTICGRHAISILLQATKAAADREARKLKFVDYSQSSKVTQNWDSSVSYASAVQYLAV